jgi:hypothetical protein
MGTMYKVKNINAHYEKMLYFFMFGCQTLGQEIMIQFQGAMLKLAPTFHKRVRPSTMTK